jgi:hypothetical protein
MCDETNKDKPGVILLLNDEIAKLNERLSSMGKFMAANNSALLAKLEELSLLKDLGAQQVLEPQSSEHQDQLFTAFCKAKSNISVDFETTGKSARPGGSASYKDLVHHTRPFLAAECIDIIQEPFIANDRDYLKTTITHGSGQWRSSVSAIRPDFGKNLDPNQLYGSALSYQKRYTYASILNLHTGGD